jgi:hypothetical protein
LLLSLVEQRIQPALNQASAWDMPSYTQIFWPQLT